MSFALNRYSFVMLAAGALFVAGCSKEHEIQLAKAQAQLAEAEAELAEARAQTEAANVENAKLKAELKRLTTPAATGGAADADRPATE